MARSESITCDICNKKKEKVNHWWIYWVRGNNRFGACKAEDFITTDDKSNIRYDACSETCCSVAFSRWMSTGTFSITCANPK